MIEQLACNLGAYPTAIVIEETRCVTARAATITHGVKPNRVAGKSYAWCIPARAQRTLRIFGSDGYCPNSPAAHEAADNRRPEQPRTIPRAPAAARRASLAPVQSGP